MNVETLHATSLRNLGGGRDAIHRVSMYGDEEESHERGWWCGLRRGMPEEGCEMSARARA